MHARDHVPVPDRPHSPVTGGAAGRGGPTARSGAAPDFGAAGLTRGDVALTVRPVRSRGHGEDLAATVGRIRGVTGTTRTGHDGDELHLTVHVGRPVTLAAELRRVLHRNLVSCTVQGGRFVVELTETADRARHEEPPAPRPADPTMPGPIAAVTRPAHVRTAAPEPARSPAPPVDVMAGALQSMTDVSIVVFDGARRIHTVTGTAHAEHGFTPEQMIGRPAGDALDGRDRGRFRTAIDAALQGDTTVVEFEGRDGETTYEATCSPVLSGAVVVGGMVVTRDVTARRRDQLLLTELHEVFELTFDHSPICQALLSPAGEWLRVNVALRELLGRDEAALSGRSALDVTHPDDRAAEDALLHDVRTGRRNRYALQKRLLHADGRVVPVHLRMSAVRGDDGAVRGLIAQVLDADALTRPTGPGGPPLAMH